MIEQPVRHRSVAVWGGMGKRNKSSTAPPVAPFHRPFADLAGKLGDLPPGPAPASAPCGPPRGRGLQEALWASERSGRGGRTVTVVDKLELATPEFEAWCTELKRAIGCGGAVEDGKLVIQGDARHRVADWLVKRGVRKVTRG
jgi:translation initiation factor 1